MACAEWGCGESGGGSLPAQRAACTCPAACSPVSRLNRDTLATSRRSQNYANKAHHTSRYWIKCLIVIILIHNAVDKIDEFTTYHFCKTFVKLSLSRISWSIEVNFFLKKSMVESKRYNNLRNQFSNKYFDMCGCQIKRQLSVKYRRRPWQSERVQELSSSGISGAEPFWPRSILSDRELSWNRNILRKLGFQIVRFFLEDLMN